MTNPLSPPVIQVGISDLKHSTGERRIKTTLGSCVAVVLYADPQCSENKACSMSHFLLPEPMNSTEQGRKPERFGSYLLEKQVKEIIRHGIPGKCLRAKVAGGASILSHKVKSVLPDVGLLNVEMARKVLKYHGIRITAENTGGEIGRSIEFDPVTRALKVNIFGRETLTI